ncbi:hypothetical protein M408DRAFT_12901 [Serendipita vermifera MAFF 305830]|uniref:Uncharacterized protein n=1 Tax=Serendipita vermifera MAFF 305830 TaxID=933852 RepID=A0A0C2WTA5_SERVB|nr:hypothetical protein M408DRAFT_12901 [Serendipita vermifera MAFF 305830]
MDMITEMAPMATYVKAIFASGNPIGRAGAQTGSSVACHAAHPAHPGRRPSQDPFDDPETGSFGNDWESTRVNSAEESLNSLSPGEWNQVVGSLTEKNGDKIRSRILGGTHVDLTKPKGLKERGGQKIEGSEWTVTTGNGRWSEKNKHFCDQRTWLEWGGRGGTWVVSARCLPGPKAQYLEGEIIQSLEEIPYTIERSPYRAHPCPPTYIMITHLNQDNTFLGYSRPNRTNIYKRSYGSCPRSLPSNRATPAKELGQGSFGLVFKEKYIFSLSACLQLTLPSHFKF